MKEIKIEINIRALRYEELDEKDRKLIDAAKEATARSYAPYSHFSVGAAALLANGVVVTGSNQENAAYPSGTCAERTTLQFTISGSGSRHTCHCSPQRNGLSRLPYSPMWSLPSGSSGNRTTFPPAHADTALQ